MLLQIRFINDKTNPTPAWIDRRHRVLYVNLDKYRNLNDLQRKFILFHELGHLVLDTSNEILADRYAAANVAFSQKYSLKNIWKTAYQFIDDYIRLYHLAYFLAQLDALSGNKNANKILKFLTMNKPAIYDYNLSQLNPDLDLEDLLSQAWSEYLQNLNLTPAKFQELGDEAQANILAGFMQTPLVSEILDKADYLQLPGQEHFLGAIGAALGSAVSWLGSTLGISGGAIGKVIGALTGDKAKKATNEQYTKEIQGLKADLAQAKAQTQAAQAAAQAAAKKAQTMTYVAIALVIILVVIAVIVFTQR